MKKVLISLLLLVLFASCKDITFPKWEHNGFYVSENITVLITVEELNNNYFIYLDENNETTLFSVVSYNEKVLDARKDKDESPYFSGGVIENEKILIEVTDVITLTRFVNGNFKYTTTIAKGE